MVGTFHLKDFYNNLLILYIWLNVLLRIYKCTDAYTRLYLKVRSFEVYKEEEHQTEFFCYPFPNKYIYVQEKGKKLFFFPGKNSLGWVSFRMMPIMYADHDKRYENKLKYSLCDLRSNTQIRSNHPTGFTQNPVICAKCGLISKLAAEVPFKA